MENAEQLQLPLEPPDWSEVFAPRSLDDVSQEIHRRVKGHSLARMFSVQQEDVEDAAQTGLLAVLDYWVEYFIPRYGITGMPAAKRFGYAVRFGTHRALDVLGETVERMTTEEALPTTDDGEEIEVPSSTVFRDSYPSDSEESAVQQLWGDMSRTERVRCHSALFSPPPKRCVAHKRRMHYRQREWATHLLRSRAVRYGF